MPFSQKPIGIFDSGVGGLTVLKAVRDHLPGESLIYLGDTARLPYGTKSAATVSSYARQAAAALVAQGIKALVVADNTSSAHALDHLRAEFPGLPVIGVVEPGAAAAAQISVTGRILVIATESTVTADAYPAAIRRHRPQARVTSLACPLFVQMVEEGMTQGPIARLIADHYLDGQPDQDCLVLGCTHFPALLPMLHDKLGTGVSIVDSATTTARALGLALEKLGLKAPENRPVQTRYLATDAPDRFARLAPIFVPWPVTADQIESIDIG